MLVSISLKAQKRAAEIELNAGSYRIYFGKRKGACYILK